MKIGSSVHVSREGIVIANKGILKAVLDDIEKGESNIDFLNCTCVDKEKQEYKLELFYSPGNK